MSPASPPHFWNQAPPRAQQLLLPDFLTMPHLAHDGLAVTSVGMASEGVAVPARTEFWVRAGDTDGIAIDLKCE